MSESEKFSANDAYGGADTMAVERREDMNGRLFVVDIEEAGALHTFSLTFAGARRLHAWLGDALKGGRHGDEVES